MSADAPHPLDGQFEPAAEAVAKNDPRIPLSEIAAASIAISLKRLADSMEGKLAPGAQFSVAEQLGRLVDLRS